MKHALMLVVVAAARLAQAQETGPPAGERPKASSPKVTVSGTVAPAYAHREGTVEEARGNLNTAAPSTPDTDFFSGRLTVRLDVEVGRTVKAVVEFENQSYSAGANNPFATDSGGEFFEQAYVELIDFLLPKLSARLGVQDVKLTLRPHADAFFLDVSESESFFAGTVFGPASSFARATADRDISEAAGVRLLYEPEDFLLFQAFAGTSGEAGPPSSDEGLFYLYGNLWIPETASVFLLGALTTGPGHGTEVVTVGFGADVYLKRWLEAFAETYFQFGGLDERTDKQAWALQLGGRVWMERWFAEGAFAFRSGDDSASDGEDGAFQSYESVERFLLAESAEFGLDWDTNVRSIQFAFGVQGADLGGSFRDVSARIDVGLFRFNQDLRTSTGAVLLSTADDSIGNEVDVTIAWAYDASLTFTLKGGILAGSDVLEKLTASRDSSAAAAVVGASLRF
jgi:hypothetical protein